MKSLPFIQELTEARLFQAAKDVKGMSAKEIAEIVYLSLMMIEVWRRTKPSESSSYAQNTLRYNPYDTMHYSATDLANLLSVLNHQDVFAGQIKVDGGISLPVFMINRYLNAVASNSTSSHSDDQTFFWRLEDYLKVYGNSAFRQMRRDVGNWTELSFADKTRIVQIIRHEFDRRASSVDLYQTFRQSFRLKESINPASYSFDDVRVDVFENLQQFREYWNTSTQHSSRKDRRFPYLAAAHFDKELCRKSPLGESYDTSFAQRQEFISNIKLLDMRNNVRLAVGSSLSLLNFETRIADKEVEIMGYLAPKKIKQINLDNNGKIDTIEFEDGYQWPESLESTVLGGELVTNTIFFPSESSAALAYSKVWIETSKLEARGWKVTSNLLEGATAANSLVEYATSKQVDLKLAYHDTLNPALWEGGELKSDVKDALGKIANKFAEFLDVKQLKIIDYVITGSNCAFNYTTQSDIDVHVMVDTSRLGNNPLTDPFLQAKKSLWNSGHDITVKGFTVELYAEDVDDTEHHPIATGTYSLLSDKWLKKPVYEEVTMDDAAVRAKFESLVNQIDTLLLTPDEEGVHDLREHLRKMRRAGLERSGEFSVENLAFKALRNNGYLGLLSDVKKELENNDLTLENTNLPLENN